MRLRRLEIAKYGAFTDRTFDFGDGDTDLHIIVGANEAGKSTALAAIGDLLWGMGERPAFAFRHPYGELRLGGVVEHDGKALGFRRRKARTGSLLTPGEEPLADSSLAPFLGGLDRVGFDRMFGLNHERLRAGGLNMLSGREDVARVLFEAGTGLSGVSAILSGLENEASAIFAGTARNKPLNLALREREISLASMRTAAISPTRWKAIAARVASAEEDLAAAVKRTTSLESRRSVLERMQRARLIVTKMDGRIEELERLGPIPALPADAAETLREARGTLAETGFGIADRRKTVASCESDMANLAPRSVLLDHGAEIVRLADATALHRADVAELPSAERRVEDALRDRRRVLEDAGLPSTTTVPPAASRAHARRAVETLRLAEQSVRRLENTVLGARNKATIAEKDAADVPDVSTIAPLRATLGSVPRDSLRMKAQHALNIETSTMRASRAFAQLAPWTGTPEQLALAATPSTDVLDHHRTRLAQLAERRLRQDTQAADARSALADARGELVRLSNLDREPPTPQILHEARSARDMAIVRLADANGDRADMLATTKANVRSADELADRREAEAARIGEYARTLAEIERAQTVLNDVPDEAARLQAAEVAADIEWKAVWRAAGFTSRIPPQQVAAWLDARIQSIEASDALADHGRAAAAYDFEVERHREAVLAALRVWGQGTDLPLDLDAAISIASTCLVRLEQLRDDALLATTRSIDAKRALADADAELAGAVKDRDRAAVVVQDLLASLGLGRETLSAANKAVEALDAIANRDAVDQEATQRLHNLRRSIAIFENDVESLETATSRVTDGRADLTALRAEYEGAKHVERDRARLTAARAGAIAQIASLEASRAAIQSRLDGLMEAADVTDAQALETVIDRRATQSRLVSEIAALRDDLTDATDGGSEEELRAEIAQSTIEETSRELGDVKRDQQEMIGVISVLSADLAAAKTDERDASSGSEAAAAAQAAETARATIVDMSARYIRAKSAATMLRWAINRHRETKQAPLLARAGSILTNVTDGRFSRLALDWSRGDEPVIVAERAGGERCGVAEMSEGTRDQLFLALRLAAIEEKAADHSMPLVCDDLFITADDARSARLLRQMSDLSTSTQVIVFTHHEHLVEIAHAAIGTDAFKLHEISAV
ncbi:AAA family ATPase [Sphingomonas sp. LB2R24]|uniref:AAA family ATPase n=1 Tax=Sphingomonas sorbitolis TaxID=3096165 RepID=UPI002FC73747